MIDVSLKSNGVLADLHSAIEGNVKRGLRKSGALLDRAMKKLVSGPGHTRNPGCGNPYPGVLTGRMRSSINFQQKDGGFTVQIGPNVEYAAYHEFGTNRIPERPFVGPTWEQNKDAVLDLIKEELLRT